jgi:Zn-dependent protease
MGRTSSGLIAIMTKVGFKLLSVIIKFAKIGKVGMAVGTMVTYSYLFTWQFASILMISLFIHENGHIWMMKRCGMVVKGIYFIPFVGAAAVAEGEFPSPKDEANIAIMGPIWGLTLALITVGVYKITGNAFFGAVAGWMAMMNLFNLLPISPLDGGRIMKSIAFSISSNTGLIFMMVGIVVFTAITIWKGIILFAVLLLIASMEFVFTYYDIKRHIKKGIDVRSIKNYSPMSIKNIILSVGLYILVTIALWVLMTYVENIPEVNVAKSIFM